MTSSIHVSLDGAIMTMRFARPEKKNAITAEMYGHMIAALERADRDTGIHVLVLLGEGGNFTAGNDLGDFLNAPPQDESAPVMRFLDALVGCGAPMIAGVDGVAVGIGTTLLLHCDLVFATPEARLLLPFVNLGLSPEAASTYLLPRLLGHARAAELFLLGEPFSGARAHQLGLVNRLVAPEALESEVMAAARQLAAKPPAALRATKKLIKGDDPNIAAAMQRETETFTAQLVSAEAREAFSAFLEKRAPDFANPAGAPPKSAG